MANIKFCPLNHWIHKITWKISGTDSANDEKILYSATPQTAGRAEPHAAALWSIQRAQAHEVPQTGSSSCPWGTANSLRCSLPKSEMHGWSETVPYFAFIYGSWTQGNCKVHSCWAQQHHRSPPVSPGASTSAMKLLIFCPEFLLSSKTEQWMRTHLAERRIWFNIPVTLWT